MQRNPLRLTVSVVKNSLAALLNVPDMFRIFKARYLKPKPELAERTDRSVPSGPKIAHTSAGVVEGANNNHPVAVSRKP